jgi:hypothetical protein
MTGPGRSEPDPRKSDPLGLPDEDPTPMNLFGAPVSQSRLEKRRRKIADEIARNRRGEYRVPTWVLVLCLVLFLGAWAAWIILAG